MKIIDKYTEPAAAGLAFLSAFVFFLTAYPYHLMRREQMNLFLFDWDYIRQTYTGSAWLSRFASDFADQFFHIPVVGPLAVAAALTGIGILVYEICRVFTGKWPSLAVAAVFFIWSFLRETENQFCTRYTLVVLGYLALVYAALRFRKVWSKAAAAVVFLAFGIWALGTPFHRYYGKPAGAPVLAYDRMMGLDVEASRENWDKVIKLSRKDLYMTEASYFYNLAHAMKGDLGSVLFNHSQNHTAGLFVWVNPDASPFRNGIAGEAWFQLGDMTIPEQSAIVALQASPKHTGVRFLTRLAKENLVVGDYGAAQKYLGLLSKTLFYGKWAKGMMPGHHDEATLAWLEEMRSKLSGTDFVHDFTRPRDILSALIEANPDNLAARQYILCYDLLAYDLESFAAEYAKQPLPGHVYQEALLIWLSQHDEVTAEGIARYGIDKSLVNRMETFFMNPERFRNTYWYYYLKAMNSQ